MTYDLSEARVILDRYILMKTIFTIACRIPGGFGEYVPFDTKASLLDADIILFSPAFRFYFGQEDYKGKPSLPDTPSFNLQSSIVHWHRELDTVLKAGKNVFILMNVAKEVYVSTGEKKIPKDRPAAHRKTLEQL